MRDGARRSRLTALSFVAAGHAALALGVAGIFLPLLPTTPFLLLASACYLRGSERMHRWLRSHGRLGEFIRAYEEGRGIPRRAKLVAIGVLWISLAHAAAMVGTATAALLLALLALGVSAYLLRLPTSHPS